MQIFLLQFFITLGENLDYLDSSHTVFGDVAEGLEVLMKINEAYCDKEHRPFQDIRFVNDKEHRPFQDIRFVNDKEHRPFQEIRYVNDKEHRPFQDIRFG